MLFFSPEAKNTFKCCGVLYLELEVAETVRAENEFFFPGWEEPARGDSGRSPAHFENEPRGVGAQSLYMRRVGNAGWPRSTGPGSMTELHRHHTRCARGIETSTKPLRI
jgi:hypothetical protein